MIQEGFTPYLVELLIEQTKQDSCNNLLIIILGVYIIENTYIGVYFELPNDDNSLIKVEDILNFFDYQKFQWEVTTSGCHPIKDGQIRNGDIFDSSYVINGQDLEYLLKRNEYYAIFLDLRGFPPSFKQDDMKGTIIRNLNDFSNSKCEYFLTIIDGYFLGLLIKDTTVLSKAFHYITHLGYINVRYIKKDENWSFE
jgi:hypothetical protein